GVVRGVERDRDPADPLIAVRGHEEDGRRDQRPRAGRPSPVGVGLRREQRANLGMTVAVWRAVGDRTGRRGQRKDRRRRDQAGQDQSPHSCLPAVDKAERTIPAAPATPPACARAQRRQRCSSRERPRRNRWAGTITVGWKPDGRRDRIIVHGRTKTEVKDKLRTKHLELAAGVRAPARYTVEQCLKDWLETLNTQAESTVTGYRIMVRHLVEL